jgi:hypothetical protein
MVVQTLQKFYKDAYRLKIQHRCYFESLQFGFTNIQWLLKKLQKQ